MTAKFEKYLTSCQHCLFFHQHWKERSQRLQGLPLEESRLRWASDTCQKTTPLNIITFIVSLRASSAGKAIRPVSVFLTVGYNTSMNMLSKPVERCRKTSYSLNLSLVLSALDALYKLLEKFCCILSLKKHLQAIHISVQSAHRTSLRRPAARTAARKSASSHAMRVVRSIGGPSSSTAASSGAGRLRLPGANVTLGY